MNKPIRVFSFQPLRDEFAIVRLESTSPIPSWATSGSFFSITKTDDELSIVCKQNLLPSGVKCSNDWSCLKLIGPFAFDETGIVASITTMISNVDIGVFVISTFDGDYILVKKTDFQATISTLKTNGHIIKDEL